MKFNITSKRIFFMNRLMAKSFYGLNTLVDIFYNFTDNYISITEKGKFLKERWHTFKLNELDDFYNK